MPRNNGNSGQRGGSRAPVYTRNSGPANRSPNEVIITKEDAATIKALRLDINDKKVLQRFAREKIKTENRFRDVYEIDA